MVGKNKGLQVEYHWMERWSGLDDIQGFEMVATTCVD
jgi:hypothetical protein